MKMTGKQTVLFDQLVDTILNPSGLRQGRSLRDLCTMHEALLPVVHCLAALSRSLGVPATDVAAMVVEAYGMPDQGAGLEHPEEKSSQ